MKLQYSITTALFIALLAAAGCNDSEAKARQAEREKKAREEETTRRGLQRSAGDYTPAPLDMSMRPKPPAPKADEEATPKTSSSP